MTIACGCHDSCPDAPDITVNNTNVYIDGALANWRDEYFAGAAPTVTLAYIPYQVGSILAIRGGIPQPYPSTWTIAGKVITPIPALAAGETFQVQYFAAGDVAVAIEVAVGTIMPWQTATAPSGWVFADGTTSRLKATYPNLWAYVNANSFVETSTATHFTVKDMFLDNITVDGSGVVTPVVIKY